MRILKYLLLITLLLTFGLAVFVATSKATYDITNRIFIKSNKSVIYNYLIDYRNWETFDNTLSNKNISLDFTEITWGKGSWVSWKGNSNGSMQTISCKENDSIQQKIISNGEMSVATWQLKDTIGGTKIIWKSKGKLDFKSKITSFFKGGIERVLIAEFEQKVINLDKTLNYEMNTYSIKNIGLVSRIGTYYLKQTLNCKTSSVSKNIKIVLPRLKKFFKSNRISINGKPFIIYSNQAIDSDVVQISICIPVKDSIFTSPGSNIQGGKLASYTAMKTKLIGDYSHTKKAWKSGVRYLEKNKILINPALEISEVYWKTIEDTSYPSKWETDIYIPILPKKIIKKRYFKQSVDTLAAPATAPTPTNQNLPDVVN